MKTLPSALTPFVRSDTVGAILAETMLTPDQEFTLAELSRRTGGSAPTVHREVVSAGPGEIVGVQVAFCRKHLSKRSELKHKKGQLYSPLSRDLPDHARPKPSPKRFV